jgi:hypothetical protein
VRIYNYLILTLSIFLLPQAEAKSLPQWVITPPGDSQQWFYSVGSGENKQQAQTNALEALSSRLQVTAQSNTQQFVEAKDGNTELYLETDSLLSTSNLTFTNIDIVKTAQYNNEVLLLVQVDRQVFFQQLHDSVKEKLTTYLIDNKAVGIKNLSPALFKLIQYNQAKSNIEKNLGLLRSYTFETFELDKLTTQLQQRALFIADKVGYQVILANSEQKQATDIELSLINQMQSMGLTSDQKAHTLKTVFSGLNIETSTTEFHTAVKMSAELIYLLDDNIIYQMPLSAVSFNQTPELAEQQTFKAIQSQLGSYQ